MSAYDDFCGCGDYSCGQCFNGEPDAIGNAWEDQALLDALPRDSYVAKAIRARLERYGMKPEPTA